MAASSLAALLLIGLGLASAPVAVASSHSFNNVQVLVNTQYTAKYNYFFTAYNTTGNLVASSSTPYPAAAFELPSGEYLLTVSAINQTYYGCFECVGVAYSGAPGGTTSTTTSSGQKTGPAIFPFYRQPTSEYGYQVVSVTGPSTININTMNTTQFPTTHISVKVSFLNGTAASGAWVSASIVGQWYYWWGSDRNLTMSAQTGADGSATLVVPNAPAVVSAWDWVKVNLPASQTVKKVDVGGQTVNVTVYWEPTYVGLAASALVIPPANTANLVLHYQPSNFWVVPQGASVSPGVSNDASAPSVSQGASGVPSGTQQAANLAGASNQYYLPTTIPSLQTSPGTQVGAGTTSTTVPVLEGLAIGAVVTAGAALSLTRMRRRVPS